MLGKSINILTRRQTESDAPEELRDKHYFWSQQQIAVSGIGSIDYRRIFSNSPDRVKVKGKASTYLLLNLCEMRTMVARLPFVLPWPSIQSIAIPTEKPGNASDL